MTIMTVFCREPNPHTNYILCKNKEEKKHTIHENMDVEQSCSVFIIY